jgi:hypothetical protein
MSFLKRTHHYGDGFKEDISKLHVTQCLSNNTVYNKGHLYLFKYQIIGSVRKSLKHSYLTRKKLEFILLDISFIADSQRHFMTGGKKRR